jgi:cell division protein FtsQ
MGFTRQKNRRKADSSARRAPAPARFKTLGRSLLYAFLTLVLLAGLTTAGKLGFDWALKTDRLGLQTVSFHGNKRATANELSRLANLAVGQNLLSMDLAAMEKSIRTHPWIRDVELQRHFPHALSIRVKERLPAAMITLGELYILDEEGEPFKRLGAQDPVDLPLVTGLDREDFLKAREATKTRLRKALDIIAAYEASNVSHGEPLSEVRLEDGGVTVITGPHGQEIRMGDSATTEKLARLAKVRTELGRRGVEGQVIHLDNRSRPGWVAVKLAIPGSERTGESSR